MIWRKNKLNLIKEQFRFGRSWYQLVNSSHQIVNNAIFNGIDDHCRCLFFFPISSSTKNYILFTNNKKKKVKPRTIVVRSPIHDHTEGAFYVLQPWACLSFSVRKHLQQMSLLECFSVGIFGFAMVLVCEVEEGE